MATAEQIVSLRLLIAEPDEVTYTDEDLGNRIDAAASNLDRVAYDVWVEKAAAAASLVDVSEAGSSRSMGSIHEKALKMVAHFKARLDAAEAVVIEANRGTVVRRLAR